MSSANKKGRKVWRWVVIALVIVAAAGGGYYYWQYSTKQAATESMTQASQAKTDVLAKTSLTDYIAVSGTIYSGNSQNVYTTQSYPIKEVFVEVGDEVKAGDVLAVLDMSNLDKDISQAELSLANAQKTTTDSRQSVTNSIENAQLSVATSELNLSKQQLNYDTLNEKLQNRSSTELINGQNSIDSAKLSVESAERDLSIKTSDFEADKVMFSAGAISQTELDLSRQAFENSEIALENARSDYNRAVDSYDRTLSNLENDLVTAGKELENARLNLQNAQMSLSQAEKKTGTVTSSVESQQISLQKLREQRLEAEIIAPIDGTVTQVNATVGMTGTGSAGSGSSGNALFVVEDMNDLYVSTSIKEFRIGEVAVGQDALVTTDATSDRSFEGKLTFIAPTATETSSSTNVEFEVKVQLLEVDPDLRIGMNAYANIILESREDIFAVSTDAIVTGPGGDSAVFALENGVVAMIPVETGMETDTMSEISGDGLREGMVIFLTPDSVTPGQAYDMSGNGQGGMQAPSFDGEMRQFQAPDGQTRQIQTFEGEPGGTQRGQGNQSSGGIRIGGPPSGGVGG